MDGDAIRDDDPVLRDLRELLHRDFAGDDDDFLNERQLGVLDRFLSELHQEQRVDVLADLVRECGEKGALLWETLERGEPEARPVFAECYRNLPEEAVINLLSQLLLEDQNLLLVDFCGTLLHLAAGNYAPMNVVRFLVDNGREALTTQNSFGALPIHESCEDVMDGEIMQLLVEADSSTLQVRDWLGNLPLHIACEALGTIDPDYPDDVQAVQLLIDAHRPALEATNHHGETPIMLAIESASNREDLIPFLHRMIEQGDVSSLQATYTDKRGTAWCNTALHVACRYFPDLGLISILMAAYRDALEVRDTDGRLPLHRACRRVRAYEAIPLLINESPVGALDARDNSGMTPIMCATSNEPLILPPHGEVAPRAPQVLHLLEEMVRQSPQSVRGTFNFNSNSMTVLEVVCTRIPRAVDLVLSVMEEWPAALCVSLQRRLDGLDLPHELMSAVTFEARLVFLALVEVLLHETTREIVPNPSRNGVADSTHGIVTEGIRGRVLEAVGRALRAVGQSVEVNMLMKAGSFAVAQEIQNSVLGDNFGALRFDVLNDDDLQQLLGAHESLMEMVTGVHRMNKAGRIGSEGNRAPDSAAFSAQRHVQVLESTEDNLSCLFLHVRGCPALFAGVGVDEDLHRMVARDGASASDEHRDVVTVEDLLRRLDAA